MGQLTSTVPLQPLRQLPGSVLVPWPPGSGLPAPAREVAWAPRERPRIQTLVRRGDAVAVPNLDRTIPAGVGHIHAVAVQQPSGACSCTVHHAPSMLELGRFDSLSMARAYAEGVARVARCALRWENPDGTQEDCTPLQLDIPLVQRLAAPTQPVPRELARCFQPDGSVLVPVVGDAAGVRRSQQLRSGVAAAAVAILIGLLATLHRGQGGYAFLLLLAGAAVVRLLARRQDAAPDAQLLVNTQGARCVAASGKVLWSIPAAALESIYTDEDGSLWLTSGDAAHQVPSGHGAALSQLITAALLGRQDAVERPGTHG